jgi:hypothetical protein
MSSRQRIGVTSGEDRRFDLRFIGVGPEESMEGKKVHIPKD